MSSYLGIFSKIEMCQNQLALQNCWDLVALQKASCEPRMWESWDIEIGER
jgi:hypothetical protein